jgi:hypothetical protein
MGHYVLLGDGGDHQRVFSLTAPLRRYM